MKITKKQIAKILLSLKNVETKHFNNNNNWGGIDYKQVKIENYCYTLVLQSEKQIEQIKKLGNNNYGHYLYFGEINSIGELPMVPCIDENEVLKEVGKPKRNWSCLIANSIKEDGSMFICI